MVTVCRKEKKFEEIMKKFYSFLFAAVALVGFAACNSDSTEDQPTPAGVEKVSFKANIDTTKTDLDGKQTVWVPGDKVVVNETYTFICQEDKETFICTDKGCSALQNEATLTAVYNEVIDSTKGTAGAKLVGEGNLKDGISFQIMSAFLKFTTTDTVTLKGAGLFSTGDELTVNAGAHYVAINPVEATLSYEYGEKSKSVTKVFVAKTIYNLGELVGDAHEMFGIVGAHQGWDTTNPDALYLIPGSNTYVRYNVTLAAGGFKFYGETTEIEIIEHPAVTTGEEGDWYLVPNSNWKVDNARFAIFFFGNGETWVDMKDENGDGIYAANKPSDGKTYPSMIFCRMNPNNTANNWDNRWNQTSDLKISDAGSNNCYTVKAGTWNKGGGTWSVHTPEVKDAWTEEVEKVTGYWFGFNDYSGDITNWAKAWSNTDMKNITVADTNKTYDIYFSNGEKQDWGYEACYTILEHGSAAPALK